MLKKVITASIFILAFNSVASAFETKAKFAVLMDASNGAILYEKNAYDSMPPSSMSKMMTIYMTFDMLKKNRLKLEERLRNSEKAWRAEGSRMFIPLDSYVSVEDLIRGVIIQSGNDAAIALAEGIAGNEEEFAKRMNITAKEIGMKNTNFTNATGLPEKDNYTTAYDLAILASNTIRNFPDYYKYYAEKEFVYNNIKQQNRNGLLYLNIGCDGLKTGHAEEAGYGVTVSAVNKDGRRLIAVVNGLASNKERTTEAEALLIYGFRNFYDALIAKKDEEVALVKIKGGEKEELKVVAENDIRVTLPTSVESATIKKEIKLRDKLAAPIVKGSYVGDVTVKFEGKEIVHRLLAGEDIKEASLFKKMIQSIKNIF